VLFTLDYISAVMKEQLVLLVTSVSSVMLRSPEVFLYRMVTKISHLLLSQVVAHVLFYLGHRCQIRKLSVKKAESAARMDTRYFRDWIMDRAYDKDRRHHECVHRPWVQAHRIDKAVSSFREGFMPVRSMVSHQPPKNFFHSHFVFPSSI